MMAAGTAAQNGAKVAIIEKNPMLGKKLLITGKGRCNITQAENDPFTLCKAFGKNGKFLLTSFQAFSVEETIDFFNGRDLKTKVERGQRVFPISDDAGEVVNILKDFLEENQVEIVAKCHVKKLVYKGKKIVKVVTDKGDWTADNFIVTTGGLAYPGTGSTGDGYVWAKDLGHSLVPRSSALAPIILKEPFVHELEGLSLKNVTISIFQNKKKKIERFGEALFTGNGMSGPIVLDMSQEIGVLLKQGPVELRLDLKPALNFLQLDARLQRDFQAQSNKQFKNSLADLLPQSFIPVIIKLSKIDPEKVVNVVTREERATLLHLLKELKFQVRAVTGFDQAIVTAGGISLKEIDPRTMRSRLIDNLFFAGEIIDLNGPTGGYNLQLCWSTGRLAGYNCT